MEILDPDDDYDGLCGEIYLTLKKCIVFHCLLCDVKYKNGYDYLLHMRNHGTSDKSLNEANILLLQSQTTACAPIIGIGKNDPLSLEDDVVIDEKPNKILHENIENEIEGNAVSRFEASKVSAIQDPPALVLHPSPPSKTDNAICILVSAKSIEANRKEEKEQTPLKCQYCSMTFTSRKECVKHRNTHRTTYKCPICQKVFKFGRTFTKHLSQHETKDELFRCHFNRCFKGFTTKDELNIHIALHSDEEKEDESRRSYERPHKCPICNFRMKNYTNMIKHISRHSDENKQYQCTGCTRKFFTKRELDTHARQHTGEKPFLCSECGESFPAIGTLGLHRLKKHTVRERKYKCSICSRSFFDKSILREHIYVHKDERKFICNHCGATFKWRKALNSHSKIHQNEFAYKCHICDKRFNQSPALYSHLKTHKFIPS